MAATANEHPATPAATGGSQTLPASSAPSRPDKVGKSRLRDWLLIALSGSLAFALGAYGSERLRLRDHVLPGVTLFEQSVGGYSTAALREALLELTSVFERRHLRAGLADQHFAANARDLGFELDVEATVAFALTLGRTGNVLDQIWWRLRSLGRAEPLALSVALDSDRLEQQLRLWEERALATSIEGDILLIEGELRARSPRTGQVIDRANARATLEQSFVSVPMTSEPTEVTLTVREQRPELSETALLEALEQARQVTAHSIRLVLAEGGRSARLGELPEHSAPVLTNVDFSPAELRRALKTSVVPGSQLELSFDPAVIAKALLAPRPLLETRAENARFELAGTDSLRLIPSRNGSQIDSERTAQRLMELARQGRVTGELPLAEVAPAVTSEALSALGVRGLVADFATHHACCEPRVGNIHRLADLIDGTLVRPGEVLSLNELIGERTEERGFVPAPTIVGGEMEETLGGGISQFATTLFNALLDGGYQILERQPHSYYFSRYPVGHEATVSFPKPDLVFKNDTEAGLLIKTVYDQTSIRVLLFGDNSGRRVERTHSEPFDMVAPSRRYEIDATLKADQRKVVRRGEPGFSVIVSRLLGYPDGRQLEEKRQVTYKPRDELVLVSPCAMPAKKTGARPKRCSKSPEPSCATPPCNPAANEPLARGKPAGDPTLGESLPPEYR